MYTGAGIVSCLRILPALTDLWALWGIKLVLLAYLRASLRFRFYNRDEGNCTLLWGC